METFALITARGGSKGIPRKNILPFGGKPLITWTIEAALKAKCIDHVFVSTDDQEIAQIAQKAGADVPFLRPSELSQDESPSIDTVLHTLNIYKTIDNLFLLQPTSPLRTYLDIEQSMRLFLSKNCPSLVSIVECQKNPLFNFSLEKNMKIKPIKNIYPPNHRQDIEKTYILNGGIYLAKPDFLVINDLKHVQHNDLLPCYSVRGTSLLNKLWPDELLLSSLRHQVRAKPKQKIG